MRRRSAAIFVRALASVGLAGGINAASAHRLDEYLQATMLSVTDGQVEASMRLIPGQAVAPAVMATIDTNRDGTFSASEQRAYAERVLGDLAIATDAGAGAVGSRPELVSSAFPTPAQLREGVGEIRIDYTVRLPAGQGDRRFAVTNRHMPERSVYLVNVLVPRDPAIRIVAQRRDAQQSSYELDFRQESPVRAAGASVAGMPTVAWPGLQVAAPFRLGMRHIAEGADHLLFLLVLLLPAPLAASGGRWTGPLGWRRTLRRTLRIVTAFTAGHSATLVLAAVGGWNLPSRPVEVLIAVSILVSAGHAVRPILGGREALVAALFGLVHGLAFAATLDRLGLDLIPRISGALAFNLGIEAMQLLILAAVLPSLLLASRSSGYRVARLVGTVAAGAAAVAWIVERTTRRATGVDAVVDVLALHAPMLAALLFVAALGAHILGRYRGRPQGPATLETAHSGRRQGQNGPRRADRVPAHFGTRSASGGTLRPTTSPPPT